MYKGLLHQEGENIQEETVMMMVLEGCTEIGHPLREVDIQTKVEDPLIKEDTLIEDPLVMKDPLEEDILIEMGDPLEEEDTLVEDSLIEMEDPLMVEDLLVMEGPWTSWWTRTTRPSGTTWTSKTDNSTNYPSDAGYIGFGEYLQLCWTVNVAVS